MIFGRERQGALASPNSNSPHHLPAARVPLQIRPNVCSCIYVCVCVHVTSCVHKGLGVCVLWLTPQLDKLL